MSNLKDAAIAAHKQQVNEYEMFQQERLLKIETKIKKQLDEWNITGTTVIGDIIEIDGSTLKVDFYDGQKIHGWSIKGVCPRCGKSVWSQPTFGGNLANLGKLLTSEFKPDCNCKAVPNSINAALTQALYDFVIDALDSQL